MKIFVEGRDKLTESMFIKRGWTIYPEVKGSDLVCFTGGKDVSPTLYGQINHSSYVSEKRDLNCVYLYNQARLHNLPCIGICRGGQFLNVMNGGSMIQHIEDHGTSHNILFEEQFYHATSTHHQEMIPSKDACTIGYSSFDNVVEVVVYPDDVCFQPHPEYPEAEEGLEDLFFNLIDRIM